MTTSGPAPVLGSHWVQCWVLSRSSSVQTVCSLAIGWHEAHLGHIYRPDVHMFAFGPVPTVCTVFALHGMRTILRVCVCVLFLCSFFFTNCNTQPQAPVWERSAEEPWSRGFSEGYS